MKTFLFLLSCFFTLSCSKLKQDWVKILKSSLQITSLTADQQGDIYLAGYFTSITDIDLHPDREFLLYNEDSQDAFVAKYTSEGKLLWANTITGKAEQLFNSVTTDAENNVYLIGSFYNTLDLDPSLDTLLLYNRGLSDIMLVKYNSQGKLQWAKSRGGKGFDQGRSILVNDKKELIIDALLEKPRDLSASVDDENFEGYTPLFFM